jgi:hypothetical protein
MTIMIYVTDRKVFCSLYMVMNERQRHIESAQEVLLLDQLSSMFSRFAGLLLTLLLDTPNYVTVRYGTNHGPSVKILAVTVS